MSKTRKPSGDIDGLPAYLKRSRILLEAIDTDHSSARMHWRGADIGSWREAGTQWRASVSEIRLRFQAGVKTCYCKVSSVKTAPWGATIVVRSCGNRCSEEILVAWRNASRCHERRSLKIAMRSFLQEIVPDCTIIQCVQRTDLAHSLSAEFLRIHARRGGEDQLLVACEGGSQSILTQAILWLALLHSKGRLRGTTPRVCLIVPCNHSEVATHRSLFLNPARSRVEVWEYEERPNIPWLLTKASVPSYPIEDRDFRWPVLGPFRWSPLLSRVLDLAPHSIQRYPRFHDYDSLRICGLEFARAHGIGRDRICFGVGGIQETLTDNNFGALEELVSEILYYRRPDCPDPRHPFYRMQAERWLECLILTEAARLFPELVTESIYPQIPVYLGKIPGRVDILGVDRAGTLVVMELKVAQDPDLPLQALDYWGRVIHHNLSGDFEKRGYFSGVRLSRQLPRIYLVSPVFSFHDSTETVLGFVDPKLRVYKIGINVDWRSGVRILLRSGPAEQQL